MTQLGRSVSSVSRILASTNEYGLKLTRTSVRGHGIRRKVFFALKRTLRAFLVRGVLRRMAVVVVRLARATSCSE